MKLLYCLECGDLFNLTEETKSCKCEAASGRYTDDLNATYSGGVPIGFANSSFVRALREQPESGMGKNFEAFVIPKSCPTMLRQP